MIETARDAVFSHRGGNATLPCRYYYSPQLAAPRRIRIKWSKLREDNTKEADVLVASGPRHRSFGPFRGRTRLQRSSSSEVSLVIHDLDLHDAGKYRCEVIDGLEDESGIVELGLRGEEGVEETEGSPNHPRGPLMQEDQSGFYFGDVGKSSKSTS